MRGKYNNSPSPNLKSFSAILLYPSLCFFEGTLISVGRGTNYPFEMYGAPFFNTNYQFTPKSNFGAKNPKYNKQTCYGFNLKNYFNNEELKVHEINLGFLINAYNLTPSNLKSDFFNSFFNNLAGNDKLKNQIINNFSEDDIRKSWHIDLQDFKLIRSKYLLYN